MNSNLLGMLGLARRGGMLAVGDESVQEATEQKNARLLLLASDAADNTERRIRRFAEEGACLWVRAPFTKTELGNEVGRASCAVLAITDIGLAAAIAHRLAEQDQTRYGEIAEKLDIKAKRAAERKAERHNREKEEARTRRAPASEKDKKKENAASQSPKRGASQNHFRPDDRRDFRDGKPGERRPYGDSKPGERRSYGNGKPGERRPYGNGKPGERRPYGDSKPGEHRSYGNGKPGERTDSRSFSFHGSRPFSGSKPVKKGKGSFRKKPDGK